MHAGAVFSPLYGVRLSAVNVIPGADRDFQNSGGSLGNCQVLKCATFACMHFLKAFVLTPGGGGGALRY